MTSQRVGWIIYGAVAVGIVALIVFAPVSTEMNQRLEFALRVLVMTGGVIFGVRGLLRRDIGFLLIGAGLLIGTLDMSRRWLIWLGSSIWLSGFLWMAYKARKPHSQTT